MKLKDTELEYLIFNQLRETENIDELRRVILIWSHHFDTNLYLLHRLNRKLFEMGYQIYGYKLHHLELEDENWNIQIFAENCLYQLTENQREYASRYENWCNNPDNDEKSINPFYYLRITPYSNLLY